jgi:hypothetical protein
MLIRRSTNTLMVAALIAALSGCPSRPYFQVVDPIPDGMAMVYVYRPTQDFGDPSQSVYINDRKIASLSSPDYMYYMTPPGIVNVKIRGLREAYVRFKVEAGKLYFLKSSINKIGSQSTATGIDVLTLMEPETGLQEITNCQLSSNSSALFSY